MRNSLNVRPMIGMVVRFLGYGSKKTITRIKDEIVTFSDTSWASIDFFMSDTDYDIVDESNCWKEPTSEERIELFNVAAEARKGDYVNKPSNALEELYCLMTAVGEPCLAFDADCAYCVGWEAVHERLAHTAESLAMDGLE